MDSAPEFNKVTFEYTSCWPNLDFEMNTPSNRAEFPIFAAKINYHFLNVTLDQV